ncbi:MAG: linear amide C-N hydrolase [Acidimicrobiales bacterium]
MCTRVLYRGVDELVVTGRSMDWMTPTGSNLWAFPAGLERDGASAKHALRWTSRLGSVISTMYDRATVEGVNAAGLAAHALYLASSQYPRRDAGVPGMSVSAWTQYALDMFDTVVAAVDGLSNAGFQVTNATLPGDHAATGHLSLADASGDSAILEYLEGMLVVHHGPEFQVMTNDPTYEQQLTLCTYWDEVGGEAMLPGTERPADRFVRARHYLQRAPATGDERQGVAEVFSIIRNASVPFIEAVPERPNVASTLWRSAVDHRSLTYYWEATNQPNVFWVELERMDLTQGAPVRRLEAEFGPARAGEVSEQFVPAEPFDFLPESG